MTVMPSIPETSDPELLKQALATAWKSDYNWSGPVTVEALPEIAARIRSLFEGELFAIASVLYTDNSKNVRLRCETDRKFESTWTDGSRQQVRVFEGWIGFSTNDSFWGIRPGNRVIFESDRMILEDLAPVGEKDCYNKHMFVLQRGTHA